MAAELRFLAKVVLSRYFVSIFLKLFLALMTSESTAHEAEGRMGYWLRAHSVSRNNCLLATDTEMNNRFSLYQNSEIIEHKNDDF